MIRQEIGNIGRKRKEKGLVHKMLKYNLEIELSEIDPNSKELLQFNSFEDMADALPRCNKCNLDLPIGRTVGFDDDSKVWAVGYNPVLREIFRCIIKINENGYVKYHNKDKYKDIHLDNTFFKRLQDINPKLFQSKTPMINEYGILEDYFYEYNDKIDKLFKKVPGCDMRIGRGIALTDLVKCFSVSPSKKRKDDKSKFPLEECINNCISYLLNEINFKKPRLLFFTHFGAYDSFVKKVVELNFGKVKRHTSNKSNLSILTCREFSCYLVRGTIGDKGKRNGLNDYEKHKQDMIEAISIALKSMSDSHSD